MTEADYILLTNLVKLRMAETIMRDVTPQEGLIADTYTDIIEDIYRLKERCEAEAERRMDPDHAETKDNG